MYKTQIPCLTGRRANPKSQIFLQTKIPDFKSYKFKSLSIGLLVIVWNLVLGILYFSSLSAQEDKVQPLVVNGDTVEYSTDNREVVAKGNVEVIYKGTRLTCQKLIINTQTKEGEAEGNARIEDSNGVIEGSKIKYNFETKAGSIYDAVFRVYPYFGKTDQINKINDNQFVALRGYVTTCSYNAPHYRIASKTMDIIQKDKIRTKEDTIYIGNLPLIRLTELNRSLKDPLMHVQVMPGNRKEWGPYILTAWRYNLTDNINGRIYLDYRDKLGLAEGFGANYNTKQFGKGDFKYYYTHERLKKVAAGEPSEFQRYLIRLRHKWEIDNRTILISEYYKITDSKRMLLGTDHNILKDYFWREYEKDSQPLSYSLLHHSFDYSSMDVLLQKRVNRWYEQLEKLPEIKYSLPNVQMAHTPFYFENMSQAANFNYKYPVPSPSTDDINLNRFDTVNKFSLPMRAFYFHLTPFIMNRSTFYDKDIYGASVAPRTILYTGAEASTKLFRIFNVKNNFLGMDINGLRHIITPSIKYSYNHTPTIPSRNLKQIDVIDAIGKSNSVSFELSNKLQTKRKGQTVVLADLRVSTSYNLYEVDPLTDNKSGGNLTDFLIYFNLQPYAWMRVDADATYKSQGDYFSTVNYDINFDLGKERSIGLGQRYQYKGGNEITASLSYRLNPKWKFLIYERYNMGHDSALSRGLREQEYTVSRDLHCWVFDVSLNLKKEEGATLWFIFRLKAFPEMELGINQSYHKPGSGSSSN